MSYNKKENPTRVLFYGKEENEKESRDDKSTQNMVPDAVGTDEWHTALLNAIRAIKKGEFHFRIDEDLPGIYGEISRELNSVAMLSETITDDIQKVNNVITDEGRIDVQIDVKERTGMWKEMVDTINSTITQLTKPNLEVSRVITSVAEGDLSQKMALEYEGVPIKGEFKNLGITVNTMVDQLNIFTSEVTRVAREVGVEGKLGSQAEVPGVAGTWKDLTENVNMLAGNLTGQVRNIALVTTAVAQGDLTQKITIDASGEIQELKNTINTMVDQLSAFGSEVTRVAREVGVEGKLGAQAEVPGVAGTWKDLTENVNMLAGNLTEKVRNIALVTTAVAQGDLTQKITVDASGEILELKNTINTMVDQLSAFGSEVTRVAREVGTEGKLGGQAEVPGVAGTWKDLTNNVNSMAQSLTSQVRDISRVAQAIAQGDLSQKSSVEAQGEILELKDTINLMVEQLSSITHDVIDVVQAVGEGDLTQKVNIDAPGEFRLMVEGVNATMDSLRRIVSGLTKAGINIDSVSQTVLSAGEEMNAIVSQLTSSTGQIADGARAQANQIADASKESGNVGDTASNTLQQAETMTRMAEASRLAAIEGSRAMEENLRNSEQMLDVSNNSVTSIESLSRSSEQIQEIVDVIRDIATQTNILAINAAIEAVRAGKHGKGFAVVAEEVKTLSADSKTQAKQISDLVKSVQGEIKKTVGIITQLAGNIERGKKSIEQTSQTFGEISQAVQEVSLTASEISTAASDQKHSIDSVSMTLDKISGIAADTSTSSGQVAKSVMGVNEKMQELTSTASTLASMSANLQQTVGQFVLSQKTQPVKE